MKQNTQEQELPDQLERDRFVRELGNNFSVIAPAGVGKTTAIVNRIASIADQADLSDKSLMSRLAVVTYTNKAAAEMKERARHRLQSQGSQASEKLTAFNRAFFGTIHGFCLELLKRKGYLLGLPQNLQVVEDKEALWIAFLSEQTSLLDALPVESQADFMRLVDLRAVLALAKSFPCKARLSHQMETLTLPDLAPLLAFETNRKQSIPVIERHQERLRRFLRACKAKAPSVPLPKLEGGGKEFKTLWTETFAPLYDQLAEAVGLVCNDIACRFRDYRLQRGEVLFEDQISLARELVHHAVAGPELRAEGFCVILDEAQDTDPQQFDVLLGVAQAIEAQSAWHEGSFPEPGRFCMVGDPQQSIYSERADIKTYLDVHEALVSSPGGVEATFSVTMRCDEAIVSWVNTSMPEALNGAAGQVEFVPLLTRSTAGPGAVDALRLEPSAPINSRKTQEAALLEAKAVAEWLLATGKEGLGISDWSECALLCPRKSRLEALANALETVGLPCQNHSRNDNRGDDPAFAWMAGFSAIIAEPDDALEVAGVLREVFVLSDADIAHYAQQARRRDGYHPLSLLANPQRDGSVGKTLVALKELRLALLELPLRAGLGHLIEVLELPQRLAALPDQAAESTTLETIQALASEVEESGGSWSELDSKLRLQYTASGEEADRLEGKIQLLTCQKAKGLEWPLVVLPYLFAPIRPPQHTYPRLLEGPDRAWQIALDSTHELDEAHNWLAQREHQSLERLLYVAMTRPRNRLILVDDEAFFPKANNSFGDYLRLKDGETNRVAWKSVPNFQTGQVSPIETKPPKQTVELAPAISPVEVETTEAPFIRRVLPSSLAKHDSGRHHERLERDRLAEPEFPEISRTQSGGTGYGNWWHGLMETLAWEEGVQSWERTAKDALATCPLPERGGAELRAFLQSPLARTLAKANPVRTEVPLLWRESPECAYDGSIDLLAKLNEAHWLLLDWKTDKVNSNPEKVLLTAYGDQLGAYKRALEAILPGQIEAQLYSTRAARCISLK